MQFRQKLGLFVVDSVPVRLFFGVLPIPPRHSRFYQFQADIQAVDEDETYLAPIAVDLAAVRFRVAVVHQRGQTRLRFSPKVCCLSGASMPATRALCWTCSASSNVSVSPSLTPTIRPVSV